MIFIRPSFNILLYPRSSETNQTLSLMANIAFSRKNSSLEDDFAVRLIKSNFSGTIQMSQFSSRNDLSLL